MTKRLLALSYSALAVWFVLSLLAVGFATNAPGAAWTLFGISIPFLVLAGVATLRLERGIRRSMAAHPAGKGRS